MDKETGEKLLVNGKEITAKTTFIAETKNGSVDVTFIFDATGLHGKEIVVFEDLYRENVLLATHADINDEGQTVKIKNPEIGTSVEKIKRKSNMHIYAVMDDDLNLIDERGNIYKVK